jgi:tetratricopeptide (TPR) repeat protein
MWSLTTAFLLLFLQGTDPAAEGMKALDAQKYDLAAQSFARAAERDPKDYTAHFNLAFANSMLGKDAEAIAGYRKVLELKPGLYQADLNLGILLLRGKRASEALPYLGAAAEERPKEPRPRLYVSAALLETGDLAKAGQSYQTALELDPKSAPAELGLAQTLARQNRLSEAEPHFRRAAELNPAYRDDLLDLAGRYEKAGETAAAIAIYKEFSGNVAVDERLGQMLVEAGHADEGIPYLEQAVRQSPTSANRLALAQAYRINKEPEKAAPVLEQAVQSAPEDLDLRMAYGRELRDQRRFADAAQQFSRVTQAQPGLVQAWNELAGVLIMLESYPQALAALDRVKALGGETAGHMYMRAIVLDKIRDLKGALASYKSFLAASGGKHPEEEFKARQRVRIIQDEMNPR